MCSLVHIFLFPLLKCFHFLASVHLCCVLSCVVSLIILQQTSHYSFHFTDYETSSEKFRHLSTFMHLIKWQSWDLNLGLSGSEVQSVPEKCSCVAGLREVWMSSSTHGVLFLDILQEWMKLWTSDYVGVRKQPNHFNFACDFGKFLKFLKTTWGLIVLRSIQWANENLGKIH